MAPKRKVEHPVVGLESLDGTMNNVGVEVLVLGAGCLALLDRFRGRGAACWRAFSFCVARPWPLLFVWDM